MNFTGPGALFNVYRGTYQNARSGIKTLKSGDPYAIGKRTGQNLGEAAEAVITIGIGSAATKIVPKLNMPNIVNSKLFSGNDGYGFKIGKNIEVLYQNPGFQKKYGMKGGTFISYDSPSGKNYRIDWDPAHGLHTHPPGH